MREFPQHVAGFVLGKMLPVWHEDVTALGLRCNNVTYPSLFYAKCTCEGLTSFAALPACVSVCVDDWLHLSFLPPPARADWTVSRATACWRHAPSLKRILKPSFSWQLRFSQQLTHFAWNFWHIRHILLYFAAPLDHARTGRCFSLVLWFAVSCTFKALHYYHYGLVIC